MSNTEPYTFTPNYPTCLECETETIIERIPGDTFYTCPKCGWCADNFGTLSHGNTHITDEH